MLINVSQFDISWSPHKLGPKVVLFWVCICWKVEVVGTEQLHWRLAMKIVKLQFQWCRQDRDSSSKIEVNTRLSIESHCKSLLVVIWSTVHILYIFLQTPCRCYIVVLCRRRTTSKRPTEGVKQHKQQNKCRYTFSLKYVCDLLQIYCLSVLSKHCINTIVFFCPVLTRNNKTESTTSS